MRRSSIVLSLVFLVSVGCGGGTDQVAPGSPGPTGVGGPAAPKCTPSGTTLQITAERDKFDKDCLAAPANQAFTIEFINKDKAVGDEPFTAHNVSIESATGVRTLFAGEVIRGPKTVEYQVDPLPAGTYAFECDVHPRVMKGTFVVA
ncbi:MAG TPA: cupredoxin domain-containing protein [Actinomycetota bacterium]|nr:cupredoxin domain-containing protein [Actinomycetota bacterium]